MNIKISEKNIQILEKLSEERKCTKTFLINNAIEKAYSEEKNVFLTDENLDYIIDHFKKSKLGTQLRLNAREAAITGQIIIEMLNSICNFSQDVFTGTYDEASNIYLMSKNAIDEKIKEAKRKRGLI